VHRRKSLLKAAFCGVALLAWGSVAQAESMTDALASAYRSNPEINSARAQTRAADENVPLARANLRPIVSAFTSATGTIRRLSPEPGPFAAADLESLDAAVGLEIQQSLFRGFRTRNAIRQAEAGVLASRELLRNTVQNVLFDAAQAYMNVIRDTAILDIRRRNVLFLEEQVRAADERFNVGENTRTDVAQTRARLATARASAILAGANLATSRAVFRQMSEMIPVASPMAFPLAASFRDR
jgi:outer membrane protein